MILSKKIKTLLCAGALTLPLLSVTATADTFNPAYNGFYYATDNDDAFIGIETDDIVLVAFYYDTVYVRDVITSYSYAPGSGTSNLVMTKNKAHKCKANSQYIDDYVSNFAAQGKVVSTRKITAYGKTYTR